MIKQHYMETIRGNLTLMLIIDCLKYCINITNRLLSIVVLYVMCNDMGTLTSIAAVTFHVMIICNILHIVC